MRQETKRITQKEIEQQLATCDSIAALLDREGGGRLACIDTYGCQQNEADSEQLRGFLARMGYGFTSKSEEADLVLLNTCAIREGAEQRVFGNVGALVHGKRKNPRQIICVGGCMAQSKAVSDRLQKSFPHVSLVFGTHMLWQFPSLLLRYLQSGKRMFENDDQEGSIAEGLPVVRQSSIRAWVSIMYGCNNFCSYCIVPHVRGRERSRKSSAIVAEIAQLAAEGYREITLLGQNVNSYGRDLPGELDFPGLLSALSALPGDFSLRFMTSHPKDADEALFDAMTAPNSRVAPQLHLPFQSGSTRVLSAMNRGYTREEYFEKIRALRARLPDVVLTSDVIVGFPGETQEEFEETLSLIEALRFDALFTFLFSPRSGTPAAALQDPMPAAQKSANFQRLLAVQNRISAERHARYVGTVQSCLVDGRGPQGALSARTPGGRLVHVEGDDALIGQQLALRITASSTWALFGEPV